MKKSNGDPRAWRKKLERLRAGLAETGLISRGSVQNRMWRQRGRGYQWTRKVAGKTVTVALTPEQYEKMKEAVANERALQKTIAEMERLSRRIIFESSPHPGRRKSLSDNVLGLN
jgi:hypothetical protein